MLYDEVRKDLFSADKEYWLVHCISADFAMGKGIVVEFNKRFDMKNQIKKNFQSNIWNGNGYCLVVPDINVFNLVTKQRYFNKPTYTTMRQALEDMKQQMKIENVTKLAMPVIGCGLDKLEWDKVKKIIFDVFQDTDTEILVCIK